MGEGIKSRGEGIEKRDGEGVGGKPVPLYIKNTDVADCLTALGRRWAGRETLKEANLEIYECDTRRKVADGELVLNPPREDI